MRALTVEPGKPQFPSSRRGRAAAAKRRRRAGARAGARHLRHRPRDRRRRLRLGAATARSGSSSAMNRSGTSRRRRQAAASRRGDLVVGIVRRPDPVPCPACAAGEWDMCRNGRYTERGIKQRNGYGSEHFRVEPEFLIKLDPSLGPLGVLLEPASVVAKAWEQVERIGARSACLAAARCADHRRRPGRLAGGAARQATRLRAAHLGSQ